MDGEYETEVDFDGDGTWDEHQIEQTEDGSVLISGDTNNDGRIDVVAVDEDADGLVDAAVYDTDHDGRPDETLVDTDGDGWLDSTAEGSAVEEEMPSSEPTLHST